MWCKLLAQPASRLRISRQSSHSVMPFGKSECLTPDDFASVERLLQRLAFYPSLRTFCLTKAAHRHAEYNRNLVSLTNYFEKIKTVLSPQRDILKVLDDPIVVNALPKILALLDYFDAYQTKHQTIVANGPVFKEIREAVIRHFHVDRLFPSLSSSLQVLKADDVAVVVDLIVSESLRRFVESSSVLRDGTQQPDFKTPENDYFLARIKTWVTACLLKSDQPKRLLETFARLIPNVLSQGAYNTARYMVAGLQAYLADFPLESDPLTPCIETLISIVQDKDKMLNTASPVLQPELETIRLLVERKDPRLAGAKSDLLITLDSRVRRSQEKLELLLDSPLIADCVLEEIRSVVPGRTEFYLKKFRNLSKPQ